MTDKTAAAGPLRGCAVKEFMHKSQVLLLLFYLDCIKMNNDEAQVVFISVFVFCRCGNVNFARRTSCNRCGRGEFSKSLSFRNSKHLFLKGCWTVNYVVFILQRRPQRQRWWKQEEQRLGKPWLKKVEASSVQMIGNAKRTLTIHEKDHGTRCWDFVKEWTNLKYALTFSACSHYHRCIMGDI